MVTLSVIKNSDSILNMSGFEKGDRGGENGVKTFLLAHAKFINLAFYFSRLDFDISHEGLTTFNEILFDPPYQPMNFEATPPDLLRLNQEEF